MKGFGQEGGVHLCVCVGGGVEGVHSSEGEQMGG